MSPRFAFQDGKSSCAPGDAYEMELRGGKGTGEVIVGEENESSYKGATANDRHDMDRLGKTQELKVRCSINIRHNLGTTKHLV